MLFSNTKKQKLSKLIKIKQEITWIPSYYYVYRINQLKGICTTMEAQLANIVGSNNLDFKPDATDERLLDHRHYFHGKPLAIVTPQTTEQICELVKHCAENNLSVVPQGGNTGYGGGATPDQSGKQILLCLSKMNQICEIDEINYTMTVEAGTILANIQQAAEQTNMYFPLSLGAEGTCQIGGNISTNAGGLSVLKYGNTRDLILGLEVVLADGSIINDLNKLRKNNTGYSLTQIFAGAEGSLGIITKAVLKTFPLPKQRCCLVLAFENIEKLYEFYQLSRKQSSDCISSFEYISKASVELVSNGPIQSHFPLENQHNHYALVEYSSSSDFFELNKIVEKILNIAFEQQIVTDGTMAQSESQRLTMWRFREAIPETERLLGGSIKHDVSFPISKISDFLKFMPAKLDAITKDKRTSIYGHIGDGNLHLNLLNLDSKDPAEFKQKFEKKLSNEIYELTAGLGGSISAEHGIGQLKLAKLEKYKDKISLTTMKKIKYAIDPKNIMNPGKLINIHD